MNRTTLVIMLLSSCLQSAAQHVTERPLSYLPDGDDIVSVNGTHRFTRALYGGHTTFRIETSDRPVFATYYKTGQHSNLSLQARIGTTTVALDSTDYCRASYRNGVRDYQLKDKRWGQGVLHIGAVADGDREGGVWTFRAQGFPEDVTIIATLTPSRIQRFKRSGDMGNFDRADAFEANDQSSERQQLVLALSKERAGYIGLDTTLLTVTDQPTLARRYQAAEQRGKSLGQMIQFQTPDAWLNPLGGVLVMAADGAWDGTTWLHGAVGWRTQLPGWRGAYMGDFIGWPDRQRSHFDAYAESQVVNVPVTKPHLMDSTNNLARGTYEWGTPMYSNGYICRTPGNNHQFNHYDMNLVYMDELMWHFQFDADTSYMRKMWPVIQRHLDWEKRTWDPDGDHLYDAYCCIWASDALQYNSGAVTHASAYNYRANRLSARIAPLIGEDPAPYQKEADAILKAMNSRLWLKDKGHWAEFQDFMGNKLLHEDAALWTIYTAIDCDAATPEQAWQATCYVDRKIPHIPFDYQGSHYATISTSDWMPYEWSLNNVAMAEVMHMALAYYEAGRSETATQLLRSNIVDFMYAGSSPGNFGQLSALDRNTGEGYRDFADVTGIASRALIQGLFGITPQALDGRCIIRPGFPAAWDSASIHTPYLDYSFKRVGGKEVFEVNQRFAQPLQIVIRRNLGEGKYIDVVGNADGIQTITMDAVTSTEPVNISYEPAVLPEPQGTRMDVASSENYRSVDISKYFNADVTDIFKNEYLSPRSPYTTLALPKQGIGDWCSTKRTADIDDSGLRKAAQSGQLVAAGVPFATPNKGRNIVYTSLWDNYPDSVTIPLRGRASHAYLMMAGSTNTMQFGMTNGTVRITYADDTSETLELRSPDNWCPIEQDFDDNSLAFRLPKPRPFRVSLRTGKVSRQLAIDMNVRPGVAAADLPGGKKPALSIPGGAGQLLEIPLDPNKRLRSLTLTTVANDVVIGLMSITLHP
ncbi:MAG: DUF4450 domain-containing protein [Prevotella sp.]|nr:DUF4450 domain-containing protein [Prevotella sp.]